MGLVMQQVETEGISQLSYLVGDDSTGLAAVIDPRRDVQVYLDLARSRGLRLCHAIETHIHADFVSGCRQLQARTDCRIHGGRSDDYGFEIAPLQELRLGEIRLRGLPTPGHTPEHVSVLLVDPLQGPEPCAVFTGHTLFNLDVGRPDLVGDDPEGSARDLYRSLFRELLPLGDRVEVYPCHGAGSGCGKSIGGRTQSTLGNERLYNEALQERSEDDFVRWLLEGMPEPPRHYARLKKVNAAGPVLREIPPLPPLGPQELQERQRGGAVLLDTRSMLAFGGGHIPGALNIPLLSMFPTWVGWMVDPAVDLLLVVESERDLEVAAGHLHRLGYDRLCGYLRDGMTSWQDAALPLESVAQWTVHELDRRRHEGGVTVLDVRTDGEWESGRVPGARHSFVPHLEERLPELRLSRDEPVAVYCGTGYRATIAASLLKRHGFRRVANVPGSWKAWSAAGLPVEGREG